MSNYSKVLSYFLEKSIDKPKYRVYTCVIYRTRRLTHLKKVKTDTRNRRNVYIEDDLYKKVSVESAEKEIDKGKVIEEALKVYFGGDERQEN